VQAQHHNEIDPAPLSPHVYWWKDHRWELVAADLSAGTFHVDPSDDLLAALDALGA
jgi:hypothetical protein